MPGSWICFGLGSVVQLQPQPPPPAPATAGAETPADRWTADYSFSYYAEDDIDDDKLQVGSEESRYEIQSHQLRFGAPVTARTDLVVHLVHESMSGATPWFVEPDAEGNPVQVMSGASVEDRRTDALVTGSYYMDRGRFSLKGGYSKENDYQAWNSGFDYEAHFNEKNTVWGLGGGFSIDTIEPTDAELFGRVEDEDKQSYSFFSSLSQIVTRSSVLQSSLSYQYSTGYLSDPYKLVSVDGTNVRDNRPDSRHQLSWLTRYRHHFDRVNGTLHADYRFYVDDWNMNSHTLELAWYQTLFDSIRLIPSIRYYTQSQAEFYGPYFDDSVEEGDHVSSDYRLSPYGALSWKLRAETYLRGWPFERLDWKAGIAWERYLSSGGLALKNVSIENPGLVSFNIFSFNLTARF